ncbi:MAG: winged helix-turn-helix transcriptional regulator [Candidatus Lokiarchaeota archaeon]|nr:winged helix-turn-helix transcriptional regulator [Candidatus Lokiarchaeota archaeon]
MRKIVQVVSVDTGNFEAVQCILLQRKCSIVVFVHSAELREYVLQIKNDFRKLVDTDSYQVQPVDYHDILSTLLDIAYLYRESEVHFAPCSSNQIMVTAFCMAAQYSESILHLTVLGKPADSQYHLVDLFPKKRQMLTKPKKNILKQILSKPNEQITSNKELGSRTDLEASSISEHVRDLRDAGYVEVQKHGRRRITRITALGKVILKIAQQWQENDSTWDTTRIQQTC